MNDKCELAKRTQPWWRMEKAHGLRQPSPPMKPMSRKLLNRAAVPPRGAFSAQMLRPPSTPMFSTNSPVPERDAESPGEMYDHTFVTSRREASEVDNQVLSPPPPPPPLPPFCPSLEVHRPKTRTSVSTSRSSIVKGPTTDQTSLKSTGTAKSKRTSMNSQSPMSANDDSPRKQSTDQSTSVHPIDTLSKKLRQQAMELTHVYEELEKQNLQIDTYKQQLQDQKRQLEKLREQRRESIDGSAKTPKSSRAVALEQQKRAAQMMIGTPSTGASLGQKREELDRKLKEVERERKKHELAAKRIEKALVELQVFENDRMQKILPSGEDSNQTEDDADDFRAVLSEQRAYIRVLEEAIHLKATDFEITGHEELLVVLAELRHTIYEQEKDVEEKCNLLSGMQEKLDQELQQHLATKNLLTTAQNQQNEMAKQFHEQESVLRAQIGEEQRQLQEKDEYLSQLQNASTGAQRTQEALQNRLAAAAKTQNLTNAKLEDAIRKINALQEQLDDAMTKSEKVNQEARNLRADCAKKQEHLDEMNALQEEMLGSVDKYVSKVKKSRDKMERLEAELQLCKEKELLARNQSEDVARSSEERIASLHAKVDVAENRAIQMQTQLAELKQEKNWLEDALEEVQQSLQGHAQESQDQKLEIAAKEQKCHQMEEAVAELEAALSTALLMMQNKISETPDKQSTTEDEVNNEDADEGGSFLLDQSVLRELEICCQALGTLTVGDGSAYSSSLCPSLPNIVARVAAVGESVLVVLNRDFASWARERSNLIEACAMLDSTARMCQSEMEKRHDEIRDYRQQLAERTLEIEAYSMQVDTLGEQLRCAKTESEAYYALQEHAANQEKALESKQALIRDLSAENDRLLAMENAYSVQVATNARHSQRLEDQQETMKELRQYADDLERALEDAASFAEQQNESNQQLKTQLAQIESSTREQAEHVKTLEGQNSAFSSRFMGLLKHYTTFLRPIAAIDRSLQNHLNQFDAEVQNGDVLNLLQLFPALVEEYISTCSDQDLSNEWKRSKATTTKKKRQESDHQHVKMDTLASSAEESPPSTKTLTASTLLQTGVNRGSQLSIATEKEEAQLAEQLELIRGAFQSFKDDMGD